MVAHSKKGDPRYVWEHERGSEANWMPVKVTYDRGNMLPLFLVFVSNQPVAFWASCNERKLYCDEHE